MAIFTLVEKLRCATRELAIRRAVYPKRVESRRMKQAECDREIALMEAIVADYQKSIRENAGKTTLF